jgi:hypothetical protein
MEQLKHECGVAMIRLLKPLEYYEKKYGTWMYGLNKLYLLMEKQHNRGQEGAGLACVKLEANPGEEYMFRERALGSGAITETADRKLYLIRKRIENKVRLSSIPAKDDFYVVSLSTKSIIYKGMLSSLQLRNYYPDLTNKYAFCCLYVICNVYICRRNKNIIICVE